MGLVQVIIDDSTDKIIVGLHEYDRDSGGTLIGSSGDSFPTVPVAGEWFWRTDESKLYRRNDGNTAWTAVVAPVATHAIGGSDHSPDTLANLNSKITDATLDDSSGSRPPTGHHTNHEQGGSDEISVQGLSGVLADAQTPLAHHGAHEVGGSDEISVAGLSGTLADPQTPAGHHTSHESGAVDEINVSGLHGTLADDQSPVAHAIDGPKHTGQLSHTSLTNIGVRTHVDIDNHIADANNPHNVVEPQCWKYQPSTVNPVTPTLPKDGDRYYNTALEMWMYYDFSRSKWLSIESATFQFGRNGTTAAGSYYKAINGMTMTGSRGYPALHDGTVVAMGYTRGDSDTAKFQIKADGSNIAVVESSDTEGVDSTLDGDFSQDEVLSVKNAGNGNDTSYVQGWITVKWRV
jgi:hypothetical protein